MSDPKDHKGPKDEPIAGQVARDARGNAVWRWAEHTGRTALDSTSRMLKKLEVPGLTLLEEPESTEATPESPDQAIRRQRESGFNPYEVVPDPTKPTPAPAPPKAAPPPRQAAASPAPVKPVRAAPAKPGLLGRLLGKDRDR
jgi:hypothetical protein